MVEQRVDWEVLFVALLLTGAIMAGMFFLGQELSERKVQSITSEVEAFTVERNAQDISRRLAENLHTNNCRALNIAVQQTIQDAETLRQKVARYEDTNKLRNPEFPLVKKQYTNLLLEYWLTTKKVEERCGSNVTKVLYIYADPGNCRRCEDQGTLLTAYRQTYPEQLLVFPLDSTLDLQPVNVLINSHNITTYPALIIEGDVYEGFQDRQELGNILETYIATGEAE